MKEIIYMYTSGCLACMMLRPQIEAVQEKMNIVILNGASHREFAKNYKVESFPTLLFMEDKKIVNKMVGRKKIEKYLQTI